MHHLSRNGTALLATLALAGGLVSACSSSDDADDTTAAGGISVSDATIPVPASDVAAVYLTIENTGSEADRLTGAVSDVASRAGIHQTTVTNGVASMVPVDVVDIPANSSVMLAPGGYHLMLMDLPRTLEEGDEVRVTLTFEHAGEIEVAATVTAAGGAIAH